MSHPLDNPFRKRTIPTKSEAGVIGSLLGDAAQTAFEAVGGSDKIDDDEYFLEEGLGETGKRLKQEADEGALERNGKWTRKRYVMWAESFGEDEEWVDEHFVFQKDGTTITPGSIDLSGKGVTELPKGWVRVEGYCNLNRNQLTSLIGAPESVGGDFWCYNNQLTSLTGAPKSVGGDFGCSKNRLTSLTGAPKSVRDSFVCNHNQLTSLDDLTTNVGGKIYARGNLLEFDARERAKAKWGDKLNLVN